MKKEKHDLFGNVFSVDSRYRKTKTKTKTGEKESPTAEQWDKTQLNIQRL